jgi:formylglycine-generating enzyme required for sulfatase activity
MLRDVGEGRVEGGLVHKVQQRLRKDLEVRPPPWSRWFGKTSVKVWIARRSMVMETLVRAGAGYWSQPYGEPEWVEIPGGEFWMGEGDSARRVHVDTFWIAKTPITNAQYQLFVKATDHEPPEYWEDDHPSKDKVSHPVVNVSWHDATAYCQWLSEVTGKAVRLPSEAEWEKAARGDQDKRRYPWGDGFEATRCNSSELGLGETTPVGIFTAGASPYGVLDLSGNVDEWTGNEDTAAQHGGSFLDYEGYVRCAFRSRDYPYGRYNGIGFRVVCGVPVRSLQAP